MSIWKFRFLYEKAIDWYYANINHYVIQFKYEQTATLFDQLSN